MRRHTTLAALALTACTFSIAARQLNPDEALARLSDARTPLSTAAVGSKSSTPQLQMTLQTDAGDNTIYLFNKASNGGYLILPADDAMPALLAYSDEGAIDPDDVPPALNWWLQKYSKQVEALSQGRGSLIVEKPKESRVDVGPLITTSWNQNAPYNVYSPKINGESAPTGCVATVMGQIMNYYKYPERGTGSHSYTPYYTKETLTANFADTVFQWNLMLPTLSASSPEANIKAMGQLMLTCGIAVNMDYGTTASSANYWLAGKSLIGYFGYDQGMRFIYRDYFGYDEWTEMIYEELEAGRPVAYGGTSPNETHAFICDGYRTDGYFHFNWGWGGWTNGYYLITELNPKTEGEGGDTGGFNTNEHMIIGIQPAKADSQVNPVVEFMSDFEAESDQYTRSAGGDVTFYDSRGIFNNSYGTINATFGVRLTDAQGNVSYIPSDASKQMETYQAVTTYTVPVASFPQSGTYEVEPVVKADDGEWMDGLVKMNCVRSLTLVATSSTLTFSSDEEPTLNVSNLQPESTLYSGQVAIISAQLTNNSADEFYDDVTPTLEKDNREVATTLSLAVDLLPDSTATFIWSGTFTPSIAAGTYKLFLIDSKGKKLNRTGVDVEVKTLSQTTPTYTASFTFGDNHETGPSESEAAEMPVNQFKATLNINCSGGYFVDNVSATIYIGSRGWWAIDHGMVAVDAGQSEDVEFVMNDPVWITAGVLYTLYAEGKTYGRFTGPSYFRATAAGLEQIDADAASKMYLSPNPADADLTVGAPSGEQLSLVEIYSASGAKVGEEYVGSEDSATIDVSALPAGIYVVKARMSSGSTASQRLIKR